MTRLLQIVSVFIVLLALSCNNQKNGNTVDKQSENVAIAQLLDSSYNTYRVAMTGYDTAMFFERYEARVEPPALNMNEPLDTKSISDLYLLKNTLLAMKGNLFEDAILASYFRNKPWYQPPFWDDAFIVELNSAEKTFIRRIDARMDELTKNNFTETGLPDPKNAVNLFQFEDLSDETRASIANDGFSISNQPYLQATDIYTENLSLSHPAFITTDYILHQMHQLYGLLENDIEEQFLTDILKSMLEIVNVELYSSYEKTLDPAIEKTIEESLLYYSIPYAIITGNKTNLIGNYNEIFYEELGKVLSANGIGSRVMKDDDFNYNVFRASGHFAKNGIIEKYFTAMTWLQKINLCLNNRDEFSRAILIAYIIEKNDDLKNYYAEFQEIKTYFSSQKQQFTFWDLAEVVGQIQGIHEFEDLFEETTIEQIKQKLNLRDQEECQMRVSLMPVENQNLFTDLAQIIKNNDAPSPIQVFAALGNDLAQGMAASQNDTTSIMDNLLSLATQEDAKSIDWLSTLLSALSDDNSMPEYMQKVSWKNKQLNAALASWVQLNDRVDLDVKARKIPVEKSDGNTSLIGYVEPNVAFWEAAIMIMQNTLTYISDHKMRSKRANQSLGKMLNLLTFLKEVSEKELSESPLSAEEFKRITLVGAECENITLDYIYAGISSETHEISNSMCYVTNVFKGSKANNVLAGVGPAHVMIVPVEIDNFIYLTKGFVYSYYELQQYPVTRLSQTQWEKMMVHQDDKASDPWMARYYADPEKDQQNIFAATK